MTQEPCVSTSGQPVPPRQLIRGSGDAAAAARHEPASVAGSFTPSLGVGANYRAPDTELSVTPHFFRGSFDSLRLPHVRGLLDALFGPSTTLHGGRLGFSDTIRYGTFANVYFFATPGTPRSFRDNTACLEINGLGFDRLEGHQQLQLLAHLLAVDCVCSRLDLALDDFSSVMDLHRLVRIARMGHFTGFRRAEWTLGGVPTGRLASRGRPLVDYDRLQVTFGRRGSKGSGKLLRVYNKQLESGANFPWVRYEAEFTRYAARQALEMVCSGGPLDVAAFTRSIGQLITGTISFVHRHRGDHHVGRAKVYGFWQHILDAVGGGRIVLRRPPASSLTVGRLRRWVQKSAASSLTAVKLYFDTGAREGRLPPGSWEAFVAATVAGNSSRLSPRHIEMLDREAPGWRQVVPGTSSDTVSLTVPSPVCAASDDVAGSPAFIPTPTDGVAGTSSSPASASTGEEPVVNPAAPPATASGTITAPGQEVSQ